MIRGSSEATRSVHRLDDIHGREIATVGAKAAVLGNLLAAGLAVPDGFAIDATAYRAFMSKTGLRDLIRDRLEGLRVDDEEARKQAAADIHVGIVTTPIPEDVAEAISVAYTDMSGPTGRATVAVRSSTTTFDSALHVLAHTNATFLCVRGVPRVLDAVRRCWASLFDERALLMREKLGLAHADLDLAVLVQNQIDATRSGLMVTVDPSYAARQAVSIDASFGLGQAAATGLVAPDRYSVDRRSHEIFAREVRRKQVVVEESPPDGGTRKRAVSGEQVWRPALRDEEIRLLTELGIRVEDVLHGPQVVEWAIDRQMRPWVLQATPLSSHLPPRETVGDSPA